MLCSDVHRDVGVCMCSVDQAEARPAIPYQRKYSHCYHTWLGCPHWPFFLSVKDELDSRPDNQCTSDPLSLFYCNIVTHRRHQVLSGFGYLWSIFNSV